MDANNSVKEVQDKVNYTKVSIDALNPNTDTLFHDKTDKAKAIVQLQARLGVPQSLADLLHANGRYTAQPPSLHAKITTNIGTQSYGADMKRFLVSRLMKKANELLGYTNSEASSSCSSSDTGSDDTLSNGDLQSSRDITPIGDEVGTGALLSPSDGPHESKKRHRDGGSIMTSSAGISEGPPARPGNKRRRGVEDDRENDKDEDNYNKRRKGSKTSGDPQRKLRFACPFYKQNPAAYARCTACVWHGFETIARTK